MAQTTAQGAKRDMTGNTGAIYNPNFLVTADVRMVALMEEWFDSMRAGATKISGAGERAREDYFLSLRERIGAQG